MTTDPFQTRLDDIEAALSRLETQPLTEDGRASLQAVHQHLDELAEEMRSSLEGSRQARSKFVSVVTHELRVPMTSIKGYADLLRQGAVGPLNDMQLNFVNVIRNNLDRMSTLVSDLSDISRIESGRLKLDSAFISVDGCIEAALGALRPKLEEKGLALDTAIAPDLPRVFTDPNRLLQILNYLLSNAYKYTPRGGQIRVAAQVDEGGDFVRLEVSDTGIGISPQDQASLFTQFFRSEAPAVREEPGWGLSLNIAKNLVEAMGGAIGFTSSLGAGSTFWFTIPIQAPHPKP